MIPEKQIDTATFGKFNFFKPEKQVALYSATWSDILDFCYFLMLSTVVVAGMSSFFNEQGIQAEKIKSSQELKLSVNQL